MKPSIGRSVHYVLDGGPNRGKHRHATITDVHSDSTVDLTVSLTVWDFILPGGEALLFTPRANVTQDDKHAEGTWHQQEMV